MQAANELTEKMVGELYVNNKKGTIYVVTGLAVDCTNATAGKVVVQYTDGVLLDGTLHYSRELNEFREKFTKVDFPEADTAGITYPDTFESIRRNTTIFAKRKIAYYLESVADTGQRGNTVEKGEDISSGRVTPKAEVRKCHLRLVSTTES